MLRRERAVDPVVGTHNSPRATAFHRVFKGQHVDLAQSPFINLTIDGVPFELGIIRDKMLHSDRHVPRLDTADKTGGKSTCQDRILRIAFEISPTQRVPVQVNSWCQQDIRSLDPAFIGKEAPEFLQQVRIPGRTEY